MRVRIQDGYIVSASDEGGARWAAAGPGHVRALSHVLVLLAAISPLCVTVASAHPAPAPRQRIEIKVQAAIQPETLRAAAVDVATSAALPGAAPAPVSDSQRAPIRGGAGLHFSWGWCTWYVSTRRYVPWSGNAIEWYAAARAWGFSVGREPRAGAIMVTRESGIGHVAYVESVDGSCWTVSEMNFRGFGVTSTRHICAGHVPLVGFIY